MKRKSFKGKILKYNLLLISILVCVTGVYFFINDHTLKKYNNTYTTYYQLNQFYTDAKLMNDAFKAYLYNPSDENEVLFEEYQTKGYAHLKQVTDDLQDRSISWRIHGLSNMLDAYKQQAILVKEQNARADEAFNKSYDLLNRMYTLMDKTSADSYSYVTEYMQMQMSEVDRMQKIITFVTVLLLMYVAVWMGYFTITTIKSLSDPIEKIIKNLNRIKKGEYDLTQISNTNLEMNELCIALEDMAESVQQNLAYAQEKAELEKRVLEQQNENLKKDELLAQSELRVLQNQINPHFLFNTLNMIYKSAYREHALATSKLMEKTSQLLRYGLDNVNKISDLQAEVNAIKNYNYIQEKRHGGRIRFLLDIEADVPNLKMPSMILQPLVENAVSHGLKDTLEDGEVSIEIMKQEEEVVIVISDNGTGMPPEQLELLIMNDFRKSSDERSHLGLYNVTKRLKAFFHEDVQILVNSFEDCGFEITLRIRVKEGDEDGNLSN